MKGEAALLHGDASSSERGHIAKVLDFFGVPWRAATVTEFLGSAGLNREDVSQFRALCSSDTFFELLRELEDNSAAMPSWRERVHSVFVYAGDNHALLQKIVQRLTGDEAVVLNRVNPSSEDFVVSDVLDDFCGVMAGLRVSASKVNFDTGVVLNVSNGNAINIISLGDGAIFLKLEYKGVPVFLSTSREIIDIAAELASQNFDVREHFLNAVPLVLYVKWAFAEICWNAPESNACLMIDDPLLKARHGFVDFQELLCLMKRYKFSTNIAFIPWNWRRSAPEVVRLFRENPECYSLSVHGCDHIRAEFGSFSQQRLYWKAEQALERMNGHQSITGIQYDPVMVFPQGIFSEAAMDALKRTDLIASVNNDIVSADPCPCAIAIADVWDIAVMRYSFPLFTRRYPWQGIENFAFDALLGKPAIAIIHHDYCSDGGERLVNFIERLSALQGAPIWRNLGDVVRRSCRQREVSPDTVEVEMYGTELRIENRSDRPKHFLVRRRESEPSTIQRICTDSQEVAWTPVDGHINFEIDINPGESPMIKMGFHDLASKVCNGDSLQYRLKAMLRRYLCEVRDNYVVTGKHRLFHLLNGKTSQLATTDY
jgi:hypothetical protein